MTVMVAANSNRLLRVLASINPGAIGWMLSPATGFKQPVEWLPYAVDNGKFAAHRNNQPWNINHFFSILDRCRISPNKPRWIVVPDEILNAEATKRLWRDYRSELMRYGWPLAFVAQDGMVPRDVPRNADVVFIGGSTNWKWRNVAHFAATFPRVHVGRVNWHDKLEYCSRLGIESVDGSGFFRQGDGPRVQQLVEFISGRRRFNEQLQIPL